jgi:hypothetical protein
LLNLSLTKVCCFFVNFYFPAENSRSLKTQLSLHKHVGQHYQSHSKKGMKKELTEKESIAIDLALKKYLDLYQKNDFVKKGALPFFMKEFVSEKKRIEFIITELVALNILEYKNDRGDEMLVHKFKRDEVFELIKNGGMTDKWLKKESTRVNMKLINKTLKDFELTRLLAIGGFIIAFVLLVLKLTE